MRDHTDGEMFGPENKRARTRSGAILTLVPARDADDSAIGVDAGVSARPDHRPARRRASGPRPVRPAAPAGVRRVPTCRPGSRVPGRAWPEQVAVGRERVLARAPRRASEPLAWRFRVRRAVAGAVAVLVTAAVVFGLGLLADVASAARHAPVGNEQTVTVGSLTPVQTGSAQEQGVLAR